MQLPSPPRRYIQEGKKTAKVVTVTLGNLWKTGGSGATRALDNMREGTAHREDQSVCKVDPIEETLKNAYLEEWVFISDTPSEGPNAIEALMFHETHHSDHIPLTLRTLDQMSINWEEDQVRGGMGGG